MDNNVVFNITICIIGILILLIHIANLILKKNKRNDEKALLAFIAFTAFHFFVYLLFTLIKLNHTSDSFIISSYTVFYIFNNLEVSLLFVYMLSYLVLKPKTKNMLTLVNIVLLSLFIVADIVNIFNKMFFYAENGEYVRSNIMIVSQTFQMIMLVIIFFVSILNEHLKTREKIAFSLYCALPLVAIILQNKFRGYAIAYASIIIAVEILFLFVNIQKNVDLQIAIDKNKDAQVKIMLSQIQPHFIYNSLSSISTLISIDPDRAQKSLDDFTDYLRANLASLTETKLVPFESELKHIETYISLEKIRFNDRVNVIYDIETKDFNVPTLTIQPIVENAVKHGILKKIEGGTVILKVYEDDSSYIIEIKDDGIGFDINKVDLNSNIHFGINNIRYRIANTINGTFDIKSEIDKGTTVTVKFSK